MTLGLNRYALLGAISYLLGSVPFAYINARVFARLDLRRIGSRNVGTTNVMLNVGVLPGLLTAIGDGGKGALAVAISRACLPEDAAAPLIGIFFAVVGHNWPVWLGFHGGGGLATCIGGLLFVSTWALFVSLAIWGSAAALTHNRYVSALLGCASMPVALGLAGGSLSATVGGLAIACALAVKQVRAWRAWAATVARARMPG